MVEQERGDVAVLVFDDVLNNKVHTTDCVTINRHVYCIVVSVNFDGPSYIIPFSCRVPIFVEQRVFWLEIFCIFI